VLLYFRSKSGGLTTSRHNSHYVAGGTPSKYPPAKKRVYIVEKVVWRFAFQVTVMEGALATCRSALDKPARIGVTNGV
jgi:hypothetical protein